MLAEYTIPKVFKRNTEKMFSVPLQKHSLNIRKKEIGSSILMVCNID